MVGDQVDRIKDWLHSGDVANVGKTNSDVVTLNRTHSLK